MDRRPPVGVRERDRVAKRAGARPGRGAGVRRVARVRDHHGRGGSVDRSESDRQNGRDKREDPEQEWSSHVTPVFREARALFALASWEKRNATPLRIPLSIASTAGGVRRADGKRVTLRGSGGPAARPRAAAPETRTALDRKQTAEISRVETGVSRRVACLDAGRDGNIFGGPGDSKAPQ